MFIEHSQFRNLQIYLKSNFVFFQVFEDALEDIVGETEEGHENINNNKSHKLSTKSFKLKKTKSKKKNTEVDDEEEIPLSQGLTEGQEAIDLFFDNRFEDSKKISQKQ